MARRLPLFILLLAALVACQKQTGPQRPTIQYVSDILSDTSSPEYKLLSSFEEADRTGDIVVIGSDYQCSAIATQFVTCDMFDNMDGARGKDGLADFGGEYVATIVDDARMPYSGSDPDGLREATVRNVIAAIDSTYSLTAYDLDALGRKSPAKVIVLADVLHVTCGKFDADTLLNATGCGISVVTPMGAMLERAVADKSSFNIGVICPSDTPDSTVYASAIAELLPGARFECNALPRDASDSSNVLVSFLDRYIASGNTRPLDAIITDDFSITPDEMMEGMRRASSLMSEESLTYGKYLSDNARFACPAEAVSASCYRILREQNLFTHKISLPQVLSFKTVARPEEGSVLLTPISFYVQD